jgi:acetyltransferase-like isoleucine patch superfamily enzyme
MNRAPAEQKKVSKITLDTESHGSERIVVRKFGLVLIAVMPFNWLRIGLYRLLFGYDIGGGSRIGWLNLINVHQCRIRNGRIGVFNEISGRSLAMESGASIGRFNRFKSVNGISMGENTTVVARNRFIGPRPGLTPYDEHANVSLGCQTVVVSGHYFDLSDSVVIGDDVTVGGRGTEFWTHGFDLNHIKIQAPIKVGNHVYFGSGCMLVPGVNVAGRVLVGAGTVISRSITESGTYVSSQLLRKGDAPDFARDERVVEHGGAKFLRRDR